MWDESYASWQHFGVTGQPAWILLDADGQAIESWRGRLDHDEVVSLTEKA